jgi:hypothetical protein
VNRLRRSGRWFSFSGFVLVALLFLFPFVTVSCSAPGGYGRAAAGATTNYSGLDLAAGGSPSVDGALRPAERRQPDELPVQPVAALALLAVVAGAVVVAVVRAARPRRASAAGTAFAAAVLIGAAVASAQALVEARLREQLTVDMPADRTAADFVGVGGGAWLSVLVLGVLGIGNLIGWWRAGLRSGPVSSVVGRKKPVRLDPE